MKIEERKQRKVKERNERKSQRKLFSPIFSLPKKKKKKQLLVKKEVINNLKQITKQGKRGVKFEQKRKEVENQDGQKQNKLETILKSYGRKG